MTLNICEDGCGTLLAAPAVRCRLCRSGGKPYRPPRDQRQQGGARRHIVLPLSPTADRRAA